MSFGIGVVPKRRSQVTVQPQAEVYAGYSWLHPGGHYDFSIRTKDHTSGVLGGLQYKYHTDTFSPFLRVFAGSVRQLAPTYIDQWNAALGAGGGFDYYLGHHFGLCVAQVDYIYSNCHQLVPVRNPSWNSVRLSAGLLYNLGNYYTPTPTASRSAEPATVLEGEPVTVTVTPANFNPKHTVTYAWTIAWTINGGKLDTAKTRSANLDTAGVAAGSYTANATMTDPELRRVAWRPARPT